jgi:hypothetical protein
MKPLVKAKIPGAEIIAMADTLLAKEPEWFKPFFGGRCPPGMRSLNWLTGRPMNGWKKRSGLTTSIRLRCAQPMTGPIKTVTRSARR